MKKVEMISTLSGGEVLRGHSQILFTHTLTALCRRQAESLKACTVFPCVCIRAVVCSSQQNMHLCMRCICTSVSTNAAYRVSPRADIL